MFPCTRIKQLTFFFSKCDRCGIFPSRRNSQARQLPRLHLYPRPYRVLGLGRDDMRILHSLRALHPQDCTRSRHRPGYQEGNRLDTLWQQIQTGFKRLCSRRGQHQDVRVREQRLLSAGGRRAAREEFVRVDGASARWRTWPCHHSHHASDGDERQPLCQRCRKQE